MLETENITVTLGRSTILQNVSLTLCPGETVGLLGPNGAGKSTLLKAMTGEVLPREGVVRLQGRPLPEFSPAELATRRGVLSQHTELAFAFTAAEVVSLATRDGRRAPDMETWALEQVDMAHKAAQPYTTLSGGEQQRVHLARVLLQLRSHRPADGPQFLLLDEPTASLDLAHQHQVLDLARRMAGPRMGVLAVLHDINQAVRYTDRLVIMEQGRIVSEGPPAEVVTAERIGSIYGIDVQIMPHPVTAQPVVLPV